MGKRIIIVGGVAGGASCAARARRHSEEAEIIVMERGPYASFANCGLPYHVGGVIPERESLLVAKPELLRERFGIDLRLNTEVTAINPAEKTVEVKNLLTGETASEPYDCLLLSPGAAPIKPPLPGIDSPGIFTVRTIPDVDSINAWIEKKKAKSAVVVGGGFIGLEMAENLVHRGLKVSLAEMLPQIMPPLDPEMVTEVQAHIRAKGVDLRLGDGAAGFEKTDSGLAVITQSGNRLEADMVILGIGVRPEVDLARNAGLTIGERGGIAVDDTLRTSDPNIWAVGDGAEKRDFVTDEDTLIPLAGPANRQGRLVADAMFGHEINFRGVQGTAVVGVFDYTIASTGASEKALVRAGIPHEKVHVHPAHHVGYYPGAKPMHLKVLFAPETGKVLGAQCVGTEGVERRIDVIAMALQMGATVFDLEEAELCYAPQYGGAKDPVNHAGFVAANHLRGFAPLAQWSDDFGDDAVVLDVRTKDEWDAGHVEGALHIPVDELRNRLDELPRDKEIRAHCGVGIRSHLATRMLLQEGFKARNLSGGWKTKTMVDAKEG